jgi:HAD superfamily hydrolase (TIGR01509 family)
MTARYGLIFDVDGVVADTERVNAEVSITVFADLFGVHGVQRKDFEAGLGRGAEAYIRAAATVHGLDPDDEQVAAATRMRQERFIRALQEQPLPPFPGVAERVAEALERPDVAPAIATSSARQKAEAVLRAARIPFERMVVVTGDDVRRKKPDPELFATAAARLALAPDRCVVIEDAPNGVEAAHAAGCRCVAVTNSAPAAALAAADRVLASLAEIGLDELLALTDR